MEIFISYNWSIKQQVKELYEILTNEFNYKVWLDDSQLNASNSSLTGVLAEAINNSKIFISCITKEYCQSYNCNLEIEYASKANKQMIILMIDNLNPIDIANIKITGKNQPSGIGLIIKYIIDIYKLYLNYTISYYFLSPCLRINCFLNNNWPKEIKNEIQKAINTFLEV